MAIQRYSKDKMCCLSCVGLYFKLGCDLYILPEDWIRTDMLAVLLPDTVSVCEFCYQMSNNLVTLFLILCGAFQKTFSDSLHL